MLLLACTFFRRLWHKEQKRSVSQRGEWVETGVSKCVIFLSSYHKIASGLNGGCLSACKATISYAPVDWCAMVQLIIPDYLISILDALY